MSTNHIHFMERGLYEAPSIWTLSVCSESDIICRSYGRNCEAGNSAEESDDYTWDF